MKTNKRILRPIIHMFWNDASGNFRAHDFQLKNGKWKWYTPRNGSIEDSYQGPKIK